MNSGCVSSLSCYDRPALLASARNPAELENQRCVTIQDIQSLYAQAQAHNRNVAQQIRIGTCGVPLYQTLSPDTRIIELDVTEIMLNYPGALPAIRGLYDAETDKIILCRGRWCRKTLIHETLHSVSFSAVRADLKRRYLNFFEGLTEFFAGYILSSKYPNCYKAWKEQKYQECFVTYVPFVKLWAAFCRFIPIQELLRIYFWDGTTNWETKCTEFTTAIHQAGYPNFENFRDRSTITVEARLMDECLKNFGRIQFKNIYESPLLELLDFTQMLR
jgi:hypothetical protein